MSEDNKGIVSRHTVVFRTPPEHVPVSGVPDGPLMGNGDIGAAVGGPAELQTFYLGKNDFWYAREGGGEGVPHGGPRMVGGVDVAIPDLAGADYAAEQRLTDATVATTLSRGETSVTLRGWVAATENALVVELAGGGNAVEVEVRLWAMTTPESVSEEGATDDAVWVTRKFAGDELRWTSEAAAAMRVLTDGPVRVSSGDFPERTTVKEGEPVPFAPAGGSVAFTLEPGSVATVVVPLFTNFDSDRPLADVQERAAGLDAGGIDSLRAAHEAWWRDFWAQSFVEIGEPDLEKFWYGSLYHLACSSRNAAFAPGLAGNWLTTDEPAWGGFYTINYNQQTVYWGCYSSNHIELTEPYDTAFLEYMPAGRENAQKYFRCRGICYEVAFGPRGLRIGEGVFWNMKSQAVHATVNMMMRFRATHDADYARKVYDYLIGVADFYEDYLWFEPASDGGAGEGRYVVVNDSCHEAGPWAGTDLIVMERDTNPILTLGLLRQFFRGLIEISSELGLDADRHEKWQHILDHLSPYATMEKEGRTVFRLNDPGLAWVGNAFMAIYPVWPCGEISLGSDPDLLRIARDTHDVKDRWIDDNGFPVYYPAAVRLGVDPDVILGHLREIDGYPYGAPFWAHPNLFISSRGGQLENCSGFLSCIDEMLLQSHEGIIRVFPVWPAGKDARFGRLRACGAFLVSSELRGGEVDRVVIESEKGRPCTVQNPWPGRAAAVCRDGHESEAAQGDTFTLETSEGESITLAPVS